MITGPATLDDCGVLKNQADLLFYQRNYAAALEKYKERLKYLVNKNNNAVLRELHMCIIHCCLKLNLNELAYNHLMELVCEKTVYIGDFYGTLCLVSVNLS